MRLKPRRIKPRMRLKPRRISKYLGRPSRYHFRVRNRIYKLPYLRIRIKKQKPRQIGGA